MLIKNIKSNMPLNRKSNRKSKRKSNRKSNIKSNIKGGSNNNFIPKISIVPQSGFGIKNLLIESGIGMPPSLEM